MSKKDETVEKKNYNFGGLIRKSLKDDANTEAGEKPLYAKLVEGSPPKAEKGFESPPKAEKGFESPPKFEKAEKAEKAEGAVPKGSEAATY